MAVAELITVLFIGRKTKLPKCSPGSSMNIISCLVPSTQPNGPKADSCDWGRIKQGTALTQYCATIDKESSPQHILLGLQSWSYSHTPESKAALLFAKESAYSCSSTRPPAPLLPTQFASSSFTSSTSRTKFRYTNY